MTASAPEGRPTTDQPHPSGSSALAAEDAEWVEELTSTWVEVYKKSATTVALLRILRDDGPLSAAAIAPLLTARTGWDFTERGLYRTLRRLTGSTVLQVTRVPVARTGAKRQDFDLTPVGVAYLEHIERELI